MGLIARLFSRATRRAPDDDFWYQPIGDMASSTGERVTPETAMRSSAVFGCVRCVTETMSTLPVHVYRRTQEAGKTKRVDTGHYLNEVLKYPNPYMTRVDFLDVMQHHVEMRGEAFAEITRTQRGDKVLELWPLHPDHIRDMRVEDGDVQYLYSPPGEGPFKIAGRNMLHIKFMPMAGRGRSPIRYAVDTIGVGLAGRKYSAKVFGGDGLKRLALTMDGSPPQRNGDGGKAFVKESLEAWKQAYGGVDHSHKVALLHGGLKPEQIGMSPEDAQLLEMLKANAIEICRIFRVPPHKISILDFAHFTNIEHQNIDWVTDSLLPRSVRNEHALNRALLGKGDDHFIKFNLEGLLRGDYKSRMEGHSIAIVNGIKNPNECREDEDLNPYEGGDVYRAQMQMEAIGADGDEVGDNPAADGDPDTKALDAEREERAATRLQERKKIKEQWTPVITEAYERLLRREQKEIADAAEKYIEQKNDVHGFSEWLQDYAESHQSTAEKILGPAVLGMDLALADLAESEGRALGYAAIETRDLTLNEWVKGWTTVLAKRRAHHVVADINKIIKAWQESDDFPDEYLLMRRLSRRISDWDSAAGALAKDQVTQSDGAIMREAWRMQGVQTIRWEGGTCEFCEQFNGSVVGVQEKEPFLPAGGSVEVQGKSPLWHIEQVLYPPLHPNCNCHLVIES